MYVFDAPYAIFLISSSPQHIAVLPLAHNPCEQQWYAVSYVQSIFCQTVFSHYYFCVLQSISYKLNVDTFNVQSRIQTTCAWIIWFQNDPVVPTFLLHKYLHL